MAARLEELTKGARVRGVAPSGVVTVIDAEWVGSGAVNLTYEDERGNVDRELVYRSGEDGLEIAEGGRAWSLDADPALFVLAAEAMRIRLAYLFDPYLAAETSDIDPLPHQIEAVYNEMLPRRPLRFLLADDPGAGKTIMAGLLIKELEVRGDLDRCLVVAPGGLVEQWQDELGEKFGLEFDLLTRDMVEASRTGNPMAERPRLIARLDMLARDDDLIARLGRTEWDLVVVDEAHKMSATHYGAEVRETRRYRLGRRLEEVARHFLLMTATPHNGKPEDFQLFMALLDGDRFAGEYRRGAHSDAPPHDLMRRMVKEDLLRFDGTRLFPERTAETAKYPLSEDEADLYERVTAYVRDGMNRAERLRSEGDGRRSAVVGFALTILQRRLASSPLAILRSLERRRARLADRLKEAEFLRRDRGRAGSGAGGGQPDGPASAQALGLDLAGQPDGPAGTQPAAHALGLDLAGTPANYRLADFEDFDPDELLGSEAEELETEVADEATAARTTEELKAEIDELGRLERLAGAVLATGVDRKWEELARLLEDTPEMLDEAGRLRKLIVFTEHRDTLEYLVGKLRRRLGRSGAVVSIHGGVRREDRRKVQDRFMQDAAVSVLVATDAAGEGLNLQRANLMVNYDLPWNPNRIEQRFGRIHRIGQTETCRLWNLVAEDTREGLVFERLLEKLEEQRQALGGKVFDVLGEAFSDRSLRSLLIDAITAEDPAVQQARMRAVIDVTVGDRMTELIDAQSLLSDVLAPAGVEAIRDQMERARARKVQPSFVRRFFLDAFDRLGGRTARREAGRYEVTRVPAALRDWDASAARGRLLAGYERVCFDRERITEPGKPAADLISPGHPLLGAAIGALLHRHGPLLQRGSVLIDPEDWGDAPRVLVLLEHEITDGTAGPGGARRVVSKRFEYVEITEGGEVSDAGHHPYVDYKIPDPDELAALAPAAAADWIRASLDEVAVRHASEHNVPGHLAEVQARVSDQIDRTLAAVDQRLMEEIRYWDRRALQLKDQELAGRPNDRLNSARARRRADEADQRLQRRREELARQRKLSARPPRVVGGALVAPAGMVARLTGAEPPSRAADTVRTERLAVAAVMAAERVLGRSPTELARNNKGYDIETRAADGRLMFIEVKGRVAGADDFTVTASEILYGLNNADRHVLALVEIADDDSTTVRYLHDPFTGRAPEPGIGEHDRRLNWPKYWNLASDPR